MSTTRFVVGDDGCWIWSGRIGQNGYGYASKKLAHRVIYEEMVGPIPPGLELDHLCRTTACVNPDHLEPVTHAENVRRGAAGRVNAQRMNARTHCKSGHEFTPENTSIVAGYRRCLACSAASSRRRYDLSRIVCAECERVMPHVAHGLCGACYQRRRKASA